MSLKTYIDSGVLINAFSAVPEVSFNANQVLDDPSREFASSLFVRLETLPKALYNKRSEEAEFYSVFFSNVTHWASDLEQITQVAERVASSYGLAAIDALHIAAALSIAADEFVTTEKSTKPMHRVTEIQVVSIASRSV